MIGCRRWRQSWRAVKSGDYRIPGPAARAARAATATIPIVFMVDDDPVKLNLVESLARPGGNATGVNFFIAELGGKQLAILRELVPGAGRIGLLVNPNNANAEAVIGNMTAAASAMGSRSMSFTRGTAARSTPPSRRWRATEPTRWWSAPIRSSTAGVSSLSR